MKQTIRIADKDDRGILIGLPRLLDILEPEGSQLSWAMFDLWITGLSEGESVFDLEQKSRKVPKGICVSWRELQKFAETVTQVIEGVFVGCGYSDAIPDRADSDAVRECNVVIRAIDSSFWEITVDQDRLMRRLQDAFPTATSITGM